MKNVILGMAFVVVTMLAGCGGGGCDAGKPGFGNVPYDCPDAAAPPASAASGGK